MGHIEVGTSCEALFECRIDQQRGAARHHSRAVHSDAERTGGRIYDLIIYRRHDNDYFLVVNAAKIEEDFAWMRSRLTGEVSLLDRSAFSAALAVQGPSFARFTPAVWGSAGPGINAGASNPRHSRFGGPHRIHG